MVYSRNPEPDALSVRVLDLPEHILNITFRYLDEIDLCKAAQACRLFLRLAGNPDFWKDCRNVPEDKLMLATRLCLSRALHLPLQVFVVKDDLSRSTKFPLAAHFYNLRGILETPLHLEEIVAKVCTEISGQIERAQPPSGSLLHCAKADSPAAAFILVRPERGSVRFELKQRAAVTAILHGLEELGWPIDLTETEICMLQRSRYTGFMRTELLLIRHVSETYCERISSSDLHGKVTDVLKGAAPLYWTLREGVQNCLKASYLLGRHPSALEDWLGLTEILAKHATKHDMELMMRLRQMLPDRQWRGMKVNWFTYCLKMAVEAAAALETHSVTRGSRVMPCVGNIGPNGLVELAQYMQQEQASVASTHSAPQDGVLHAKNSPELAEHISGYESQESSVDCVLIGTADSASAEAEQAQSDDHIARVLRNLDPVLVARLRLRARLHLEVLRIMDWCFFMLGTDCEQQSLHVLHQSI